MNTEESATGREQTPNDYKDHMDSILKSVNETSDLTRNVHLIFITVFIYAGILISSTTHEHLLGIGYVKVPGVESIPSIVAMYILGSVVWIVLHFNMLLLLSMLARKLYSLRNEACKGMSSAQVQSYLQARLHAFPISHWLLRLHSNWIENLLFTFYVYIANIIFPVLLLLLMQHTFLPYHDYIYHFRFLIIVDLALIWFWWPRIINEFPAENKTSTNGPSSEPSELSINGGLLTLCRGLPPLKKWQLLRMSAIICTASS